ncbi:LpxI family protein [Palleronia sp. LCG004]|uniref:LpxI family protein n=1 Tax=Palleronia sp. LCG004 TaxID=3079304 RepID=UPI002943B58F|nr:UDP-2,3-diacylglucosamine diphosphatase LpxI [Palleronia sp. LCG004]WOI57020.1 UDP-2,3-diacylglucosamine diphosphatase LpxI [Palleronia sp. LCG004]
MKTALIAGEGRLPLLLAERVEFDRIAALEGFEPEGLKLDRRFRGETIGSFIADLASEGITRICLAGGIARPALDPSKLDAATMPLVPRLAQAVMEGDDAALRMVLTFFEESGITPVGAHELCPELLPPEGMLAGELTDAARRDVDRGDAILAAMGAVDIGQACVVARGQALAIEAMAGTDWMLATLAAARGQGRLAVGLPQGGILCKAPKPTQDRRVDLPAIGPDTIRNAAAAGLSGIAIEAGGVMLLDAEEAIALSRDSGLLLWVWSR